MLDYACHAEFVIQLLPACLPVCPVVLDIPIDSRNHPVHLADAVRYRGDGF